MDQPPPIDWPVPGAFPALKGNEVHVWCAWLDAPGADGPAAAAVLSGEERARAAAFHFAADRRRYVASHAMLRNVLAGYVAGGPANSDHDEGAVPRAQIVSPSRLEITKGPSGK